MSVTMTDEQWLTAALKALSAQASNAAYFMEHRDDPAMLDMLAKAGKTVDERIAETLRHMRHFQDDVATLLEKSPIPARA